MFRKEHRGAKVTLFSKTVRVMCVSTCTEAYEQCQRHLFLQAKETQLYNACWKNKNKIKKDKKDKLSNSCQGHRNEHVCLSCLPPCAF